MDVNITLSLLVALSSGATIVRILSGPLARVSWNWIVVSVVLLTSLGIAWVLAPDYAGYIGGILWLLLFLLPVLGYRQINRLFAQQNYQGAIRVASVVRWLHPVRSWSNWLEVIKAMDLARTGDVAQARALLERNIEAQAWIGRTAQIQLYLLDGDWQQLLAWLQRIDFQRDPNSLGYYIRALGETGDLNGMVTEFERNRVVLQQSRALNSVALFVLALSAQREEVETLFQGALRVFPDSLQKFWLASTDLAAGNRAPAEPVFTELASNAEDARTRRAAAARLAQGLPIAQDILTTESQQSLVKIQQMLDQEQRFGPQSSGRRKIAYVTYALIAINVLVFLVEEFSGGSTNSETIYKLGALWAPDVVNGQWWRLITPLFLHFGWLHLLLNMVALYVLGPYVEAALGTLLYLVVYFVSGIGASILVFVLVQAGGTPNDLFLGASGAIMGVLGAMGAIMYRGWRREKAPVARNRLLTILLIIGMQVVLDASMVLQSSLPAHLGGAILGFVIASLVPHHRTKAVRQPDSI